MTKRAPAQGIAEQARKAYEAGDLPTAVQLYTQAASGFSAEGDALASAEMKNNLAVALLRSGQAEAALEAAGGTDRTFAAGGDPSRQGMALANQGAALQALRRVEEAVELYKRSAEALAQAEEGDLRAEVMQLLAVLYMRRLKFYDAILALQSGLAGVRNPTAKQRLMKKILFRRL
jgi:tetratricopeptide (TPR) repeat protein